MRPRFATTTSTQALEALFEGIAERRPEPLAHHYTEAALVENAAILWGRAGRRSLSRSAYVEAENQLTRAIDQIETLPSNQALRYEQIELLLALHQVCGHVKGYGGPDEAKAERSFQRALSVARAQQAKSYELRAAMSLARLWRDQGKSAEARELLAPVYGWFTAGFGTRHLKEAKALLDALAS